MNKIFSTIILIVFLLFTLFPSVSECSDPESIKIKTAKVHIKILEIAIGHLSVDIGRIPTTEEGLLLLIEEPTLNIGWQGSYLPQGIPLDPWGEKYIYSSPAKHGTEKFDLYSSGSNRIDEHGNVDDITNWLDSNR